MQFTKKLYSVEYLSDSKYIHSKLILIIKQCTQVRFIIPIDYKVLYLRKTTLHQVTNMQYDPPEHACDHKQQLESCCWFCSNSSEYTCLNEKVILSFNKKKLQQNLAHCERPSAATDRGSEKKKENNQKAKQNTEALIQENYLY